MNQRVILFFSAVSMLLYSCSTVKPVASINTDRKQDTIQHLAKKNVIIESASHKPIASHRKDSISYKANPLASKYSSMMNVDEKQLNNIELLKFMDEWYGVPYHYGGKSKQGIDCSDFTCTLLHDVYGINMDGSSKALRGECITVRKNDLQEGDLVFFKIRKGRISHVGVYIANNYFIHASTKLGVVISSLDEDYYKKYFSSGGRVRKKEQISVN